MPESTLDVRHLRTQFFTRDGVAKAVEDISFSLGSGEVLGLVGESGSGKTVTGFSILGLVDAPGKVVGGEILFKGRDLLKLSEEEMRKVRGNQLAMVFQDPMMTLNPVLRIDTQMIEAIQAHQNLRKVAARELARDALGKVGIASPDERLRAYPHQFSGGMRQRIMIAMSLQCNPALLIADEPTTALDVTIQAQILDLMMDLKNKRKDAAILLITHDLAVIAETCDRVIVMYGGVIQEIAPIDKLFGNPIHPYTKALMDSIPKMDLKAKRLKALKGMVPSILELDDGCKLCSRFDPEECACKGTKIEQDLVEISKGHFARVHKDLIQ